MHFLVWVSPPIPLPNTHTPQFPMISRGSQLEVIPKYEGLLKQLDKAEWAIAWANGKLVRQASFQQLRTMACQVTAYTGLPFEVFRLPPWAIALIAPLAEGEARILTPNGRWLLRKIDEKTKRLRRVHIPTTWSSEEWPVFNLTIDHCAIGSAGVYLLLRQSFVVKVTFDWFHELWNNIKNSAKRSTAGRQWQAILAFMLVCNYNHGPFRSGSWHVGKREALEFWMQTHDMDSPEFQEIVHDLGRDWQLPSKTADEQSVIFASIPEKLRSFREVGPTLKLARWGSINEAWQWYEPELRASKLILADLAGQEDVGHCALAADSGGRAGGLRAQGTVKMAPKALNEAMFSLMRVFAVVSAPAWAAHGRRASLVTTPKLGRTMALLDYGGRWQELLVKTIRVSCYDKKNAEYIGFGQFPAVCTDDLLAEQVAEFALGFVSARCASQVLLDTYPDRSVGLLSREDSVRRQCMDQMRRDWATLKWAETIANSSAAMRHLLNGIHWRLHAHFIL